MTVGYDKPLYILPFDHRSSFEKDLFKFSEPLSVEQTRAVGDSKRVIYDGFKAALDQTAPKEAAGILVDEQFGAEILRDARAQGYITCAPVEKSGQEEFDFEYGDRWREHIEAFEPNFIKALVRYNPEGDEGMNRRQAGRLHELSAFARRGSRQLLFELLVPMTHAQSDRIEGDQKLYDKEIRPPLMVGAIQALQDAGVEPDVWKIEGLGKAEDCRAVVAAARRQGRDKVSCIVLGRGSDEATILSWLKTAAAVNGFIGFAVGRTSFWDALVALQAKQISRDEAVKRIADRYLEWISIYQTAQSSA